MDISTPNIRCNIASSRKTPRALLIELHLRLVFFVWIQPIYRHERSTISPSRGLEDDAENRERKRNRVIDRIGRVGITVLIVNRNGVPFTIEQTKDDAIGIVRCRISRRLVT